MFLPKILAEIDGNKLTAMDIMALRYGIPPKQLQEFWIFCFGDGYKKLHPTKLIDRWNNKHSDYLILRPWHSVEKSIKLMAAIFQTK